LREVVERYVDAWEHNDVEAVVAMLAADARMTMPPLPTWYTGREAIAIFLRGWPLSNVKRWRLVPSSANAQLAFGGYLWDEETETSIMRQRLDSHRRNRRAYRVGSA